MWLLLLLTITAWTELVAQPRLTISLEVEDNLLDIVFRNNDVGYGLAGESVWQTTDGGETWKLTMPLAFRPYFTAMGTFGEHGMIIGDETGGIHVARNPDSMWITTTPLEGVAITEIEVIDERRWAAIAGPTVLVTDDGGATYRQFTPQEGGSLAALDITDASLMHICESGYYVWRSTDAGETWNRLDASQFGFGTLFDAQFTSLDTGLVASWYPWNVFTTFDGGKNWYQGPYDYPTSIAVASNDVAAYTTDDVVRFSYDHGKTWVDSLGIANLANPEAFQSWTKQKIIALENNTLMLLLLDEVTRQSRIVKINVDVPSSVIEEGHVIQGELDLSLLMEPSGN